MRCDEGVASVQRAKLAGREEGKGEKREVQGGEEGEVRVSQRRERRGWRVCSNMVLIPVT